MHQLVKESADKAACNILYIYVLLLGILLACSDARAKNVGEICSPTTRLPHPLSCVDEKVVDCGRAESSSSKLGCASESLKNADRELNQIYLDITKIFGRPNSEYSNYEGAKESLVEAQRAWVRLKKADCQVPGLLNPKGSIQSIEAITCELEHTRSRITYLRDLRKTLN